MAFLESAEKLVVKDMEGFEFSNLSVGVNLEF